MNESPAVFIVGFVALLIVVIAVALYSKKKYEERKAALAAWAADLGFQFYPEGVEVYTGGFFSSFNASESFLGRFQEFSPFGEGDRWRVPILMTGQKGDQRWTVFDYEYQTESRTTNANGTTSTSRTTHRYTVFEVQVPMWFPRIDIRPEGFFDRIGGALGFKDLTFELDEFNRRYYVKSGDERVAYGLIHPQMIEYLMRIPCYHWQILGNQLVIAMSGMPSVPEIDRVSTDINDFIKLVPDYMRQDLGARS
jgi:hypothetical protein